MQTHHRLRRHAVVNKCSQIHPKARAAQADPASGRALSALRPQGRSLSFRRWSPKAAERLVTALHARRQSRKPGKRRRARHRNCRTAGLNAGARKGAAKKPFPKSKKPGFLTEDRAFATDAASELRSVRSRFRFTRKLPARGLLPPPCGHARKPAPWQSRQRLFRRKRMAKRKTQTTLLGQKTIAKPAAQKQRGTSGRKQEERNSAIRSCTFRRPPWRPKTVQGTTSGTTPATSSCRKRRGARLELRARVRQTQPRPKRRRAENHQTQNVAGDS